MVKMDNYNEILLSRGTNREENGELERKKSDQTEETDNTEEKETTATGEEKSENDKDNYLKELIQEKDEPETLQTETKDLEGEKETSASVSYPVIAAGISVLLILIIIITIIIKKRKNNRDDEDLYERKTEHPDGYDVRSSVKINRVSRSSPAIITTIHGIGSRSAQQDSFGISDVENSKSLMEKGLLAIVADGMGGLEDGDKMSQLVVVTMLSAFDEFSGNKRPPELLLDLLDRANDAVNRELGSERRGQSGSTLVAVLVKEDKLYFISVGDSHIYLYREGRIRQINHDHNYAAELDEMAKNGEISYEDAALNPKRAALTSFLGMGDLELVDQNDTPIIVKKGDRILLMSDGVYGTVGDENLCHAMDAPLKRSGQMINEMIKAENKQNQDNYTCILMEIT
jgi:serine/threonine protein phosphatase PrpC